MRIPAGGALPATREEMPRVAAWLAQQSRLDSFAGAEPGWLASIGDLEIEFRLVEADAGFEMWFVDRGVRRLVARASHLDDAIRYLACELLHGSSPADIPALTRADVDARFRFVDTPEATTLHWADEGVERTLEIRASTLVRERRAAWFARCARASLGMIAVSMRAPGGAPLLSASTPPH